MVLPFISQRYAKVVDALIRTELFFLVGEDFMAVLLEGGAHGTKVWGDQAAMDKKELGCIPVVQYWYLEKV